MPDLQEPHLGEAYSSMKPNLEFYSDSEPDSNDKFQQFEYNLEPDRSNISKFYFEKKSRTYSEKNLKAQSSPRKTSLMSINKSISRFTLSPLISPSLSINISNDSSIFDYKSPRPAQARLIEKIFEPSSELAKIPELNSTPKSTNPSYTSSNCNKSSINR